MNELIPKELVLNDNVIREIKVDAVRLLTHSLKDELVEIVLYGSCARGDYTEDSDIDIALIIKCNRLESHKYNALLAEIATDLAMKYLAIVNFVCIPLDEYISKKSWYQYFRNIEAEGEVLYGEGVL